MPKLMTVKIERDIIVFVVCFFGINTQLFVNTAFTGFHENSFGSGIEQIRIVWRIATM